MCLLPGLAAFLMALPCIKHLIEWRLLLQMHMCMFSHTCHGHNLQFLICNECKHTSDTTLLVPCLRSQQTGTSLLFISILVHFFFIPLLLLSGYQKITFFKSRIHCFVLLPNCTLLSLSLFSPHNFKYVFLSPLYLLNFFQINSLWLELL